MKKKIIIICAIVFALIIVIVAASNSGKNKSKNYDASLNLNSTTQNTDVDADTDTLPEHLTEVPDGYIGIYTAEDFQNASKNKTANYIIMNDIDLNGVSFESFRDYTGNFNGNNYIISNYSSEQPMFVIISDAIIENLHFENAEINGSGYEPIGGIIGSTEWRTENSIFNCSFSGTVTNDDLETSHEHSAEVGGIIGMAKSSTHISECSFNGTINVNSHCVTSVGGIAGFSSEQNYLDCCYSNGSIDINNTIDAGGICGVSEGIISDCYSEININVDSTYRGNNLYIGGIVGRLENICKKTYYIGNISKNTSLSEEAQQANMYEEESKIKISIGAIAGKIDSESDIVNQIQYCYYNSGDLGAGGNSTPYANVNQLSFSELTNQNNFEGFSFGDIWNMGDGQYKYPVLLFCYNQKH